MTIIEIRPHDNGWKVFEALGVEPVFLAKEQAVNYAQNRACFRSGEIRVLDCDGAVQRNFGIDMWFMNGHAPRPIGVQVNPGITEGN